MITATYSVSCLLQGLGFAPALLVFSFLLTLPMLQFLGPFD